MARVLLGLGTNVGDRAANLRAALSALRRIVEVVALSDVYESEPWGHADQARFWNMAAAVDTAAAPEPLLLSLQALELSLGRVPTFRMGPRLIDIDILMWDDIVLNLDTLTIPHPGVIDRPFVLRPLLDLVPDGMHPVTQLLLQRHREAVGEAGLQRVGRAADVLGGADVAAS